MIEVKEAGVGIWFQNLMQVLEVSIQFGYFFLRKMVSYTVHPDIYSAIRDKSSVFTGFADMSAHIEISLHQPGFNSQVKRILNPLCCHNGT